MGRVWLWEEDVEDLTKWQEYEAVLRLILEPCMIPSIPNLESSESLVSADHAWSFRVFCWVLVLGFRG